MWNCLENAESLSLSICHHPSSYCLIHRLEQISNCTVRTTEHEHHENINKTLVTGQWCQLAKDDIKSSRNKIADKRVRHFYGVPSRHVRAVKSRPTSTPPQKTNIWSELVSDVRLQCFAVQISPGQSKSCMRSIYNYYFLMEEVEIIYSTFCIKCSLSLIN